MYFVYKARTSPRYPSLPTDDDSVLNVFLKRAGGETFFYSALPTSTRPAPQKKCISDLKYTQSHQIPHPLSTPTKRKMPKSLSKVQKKVTKKHNGAPKAIHANSRDAQRLRRAGARDDKIGKTSALRAKINEPYSMARPTKKARPL